MHQALQFTESVMLRTLDQLTDISHNIANVNTPAYKTQHSFANVINAMEIERGQNVTSKLKISFDQGLATQSTSPYHLMIEGNGFFAVSTDDNQILLTRRGDFQLDASGTLVTTEGYRVLGEMGDIRVTDDIEVDESGSILSEDQIINQLQVVTSNTATLVSQGQGYFKSAVIPQPAESEEFKIRQGVLEGSNVDTAKEFTNMITIMRQFEMQQKLVKVYDQLLNTGISTLGEF